jgi:hypothetical protein
MATFDQPAAALTTRPSAAHFAPALFAVTLFVSALLLFAMQPMFTKMLLPRLGGAPAVWSVAMVVFQAALLAGYAYAHLLSRTLRPGYAALVHVIVLGLASAVLPIGIASGFGAPPENGLVVWLCALIATSIGLPFAALSASAPLLQNWFAASGHARARNPYVLYAASNVGSFAALLAYPLAIEPLVTLRMQAWLWSLLYAGLTLLIAAAGIVAARGTAAHHVLAKKGASPRRIERARWIVLAAIPSGLVVAVTAHITTDIAAAPFLWIMPLALYLLTFVILFRDRPWVSQAAVARLAPFAVAPLAIGLVAASWLAAILLNVAAFFLLTLVCHGELYRRRPAPAWLTEFYLWTSLGGVLGGIFAALLAPNIFSGTYEYPVLVVAALLALPATWANGWRPVARIVGAACVVVAGLVVLRMVFSDLAEVAHVPVQLGLVGLGVLMLLRRDRPAEFAAMAAVGFAAVELWLPTLVRIETARSFFGVHQVVESPDRQFRLLFHGTTIHGADRMRAPDGAPTVGRPQPRTYYYFGGPLSEGIGAARRRQTAPMRVAAVGLGTGSLACHRQEGENWTFFEIDPEVVRIARDPKLFRFLSACAPDAPIVLGDARLTLTASAGTYDLIVLDAFSSDTVPVHLLTREAFAGYLARLSPSGLLMLHISNRHMDLSHVVAAVGAAENLLTLVKRDESVTSPMQELNANSIVAVLAREPKLLADLANKPGWRRMESETAPWTDDYSDILGALLRSALRAH